MNKKDNEQGAALVIVLGIIMLLMIFGGTLAAQMTNTQSQINVTEKTIDARNLARMGLDHAAIKVSQQFKKFEEKLNTLDSEDFEYSKKKDRLYNDDFANVISSIKAKATLDERRWYAIDGVKVDEDNPNKITLKATGSSEGTTITETNIITIKDELSEEPN